MVRMTALWTGVGFLLGAMPFSYWLGRLFLHADIRAYGDGNPGAANAWRAGKWQVGLPALLLDYLKGAVPVILAQGQADVSGWALLPVALAPVLGHAFSPFLRFKGGKAVAATFGIWTGLTLWEGPVALGLSLGFFHRFQVIDAWTVMMGMSGLFGYLLLRGMASYLLVIWAGNMLILVWKHRAELHQRPQLRPWVRHLLQRG
jgi:glycerol-3-phosphate acyltransferase PlsY